MVIRAIQESSIFDLARKARRLPGLVVAVLLSMGFLLGSAAVGAVLMTTIFLILDGSIVAETPTMGAVRQDIMLVTAFVPVILVVWLWVYLYEKRPVTSIGLSSKKAPQQYLLGFIIGLALLGFSILFIFVTGYLRINSGLPGLSGVAALGGILLVLPGWIIQGGAEEILIRGWLMPVIGARYKPIFGLFVSALIFTAYHSLNPNFNLLAILNLFLFGILTGLYVLKEGSLWGVMGLHAAWNWAEGNLLGFPVSGVDFRSGSLVYLKEAGPSYISGGGFGPEGGIAVTLALLVGIFVIGYTLFREANTAKITPDSPL